MIEIADKSKCCGCSACANICPKKCIEMKEDLEGFLYPIVDFAKCVQCSACERICPMLSKRPEIPFEQEGYIVQNREEQVLRESTAGGAFTSIARYVLHQNGVVFGVELDKELLPHHIFVESEAELFRFRNSKYVQSVVGDTYTQVKEFLQQGRLVCYSGTPCQIEGLKSFLEKEYSGLITVDVVCRAVPSPLIFRKYLEMQREKMGEEILKVRFRDKYFGYQYSTLNIVTAANKDNYHRGVESDPWLRAFFSNICDRPSCHTCIFRKRYHISDFTIWDCFHVGRFSKELDNNKGATRVLVHTRTGKTIFQAIIREFHYISVEPEQIIAGAKEMQESVLPHKKRKEFLDDAQVLNGTELFAKYFPETPKVKWERIARFVCYKLGIYSVIKKIYVKLTNKY